MNFKITLSKNKIFLPKMLSFSVQEIVCSSGAQLF